MSESQSRKRRFNPSAEDSTPAVERLYRERQPSFAQGGGFVVEESEEVERRKEAIAARKKHLDSIPRPDVTDCERCQRQLLDSWLWEKFALPVCDACKDVEGDHVLVSRTEAMTEYLLKAEDLDIRRPPLRFIAKKNPHNPRYGDMKLYIKCQIIDRMLMVHGSWEELAEKKEKRLEGKEKRQEVAFDKKVKEIRKLMRDATGEKAKVIKSHRHEFGEEKALGGDEWMKECTECGYQEKFEKM